MSTRAFTVGTITSDHVILEIFGYAQSGAADKIEANRLKASLSVSAGAWRGRMKNLSISTGELVAFYKQLQVLDKDQKGQAAFEPLEAFLTLKLHAAPGFIDVSGVAFDQPDGHNALAFNWALEPQQLKPLLRQLEDLQSAYPQVN